MKNGLTNRCISCKMKYQLFSVSGRGPKKSCPSQKNKNADAPYFPAFISIFLTVVVSEKYLAYRSSYNWDVYGKSCRRVPLKWNSLDFEMETRRHGCAYLSRWGLEMEFSRFRDGNGFVNMPTSLIDCTLEMEFSRFRDGNDSKPLVSQLKSQLLEMEFSRFRDGNVSNRSLCAFQAFLEMKFSRFRDGNWSYSSWSGLLMSWLKTEFSRFRDGNAP